MKYIVNEENTCGQATLSNSQRALFMEAMGFKAPQDQPINESVAPETLQAREQSDQPALYEWDQAIFALEDEVFEIEGDLFLKATELDAHTRSVLDESHSDLFINEVSFDEYEYTLADIYDYGTEIYIKLDEGKKKGDKSADKKDDDDEGDFETGARKGDKGAGKDKGDKPDFTTDQRKGDKSKTHAGKDFDKDDEKGDPRAFGGKKGDKSKTHGGKDFQKEANGDDMSDDDIDAAMNKNAPKDPKQVALRKKLEKGKPNKDAEAVAAADAK